MNEVFKVYGVPMSQAVRSVIWLLFYKKLRFELILTIPGSLEKNGSRYPDYLAKFPTGTIPGFEDPETGYVLYESHAIMCYLCNRYSWDDLYPKEHEKRAKVDAFLNFHHRNLKEASLGYFAPKVRTDLDLPEIYTSISRSVYDRALDLIEGHWLVDNSFIIGEELTIADFTAYVEIGQLQDCFTNLYDYSRYPNISGWLKKMREVDSHDDVHLVLEKLGDISKQAPSLKSLMEANMLGFELINKKLDMMN